MLEIREAIIELTSIVLNMLLGVLQGAILGLLLLTVDNIDEGRGLVIEFIAVFGTLGDTNTSQFTHLVEYLMALNPPLVKLMTKYFIVLVVNITQKIL